MELSSKVAIVTGGSSGIGRAIAQLYAREGAKVVVADISEGKGTVTDIQNERGTALFVKTDVRTEAEVRALVDETVRSFGGLDIVCNSVGIELIRPLAETTEEEWNRILDTNLKGPFLVCKHALPHMMRKKNGVIVNIASQLGIVGLGGMTAYCAVERGAHTLDEINGIGTRQIRNPRELHMPRCDRHTNARQRDSRNQ